MTPVNLIGATHRDVADRELEKLRERLLLNPTDTVREQIDRWLDYRNRHEAASTLDERAPRHR